MTMRRLARASWRYSWLLTLPVTIALVVWLRTTLARHQSFRVERATLADFSLRNVGAMTFGELVRHLETDWTRMGDRQPLPGLRTFDLHVPAVHLARLDADLPHSGFEYVQGMLRAGRQAWRVDVRYRGDNVYHWGYAKKSWRVKTKKSRLFEGMRAFNLIAPRTPELLNNYLAYRVARRLGLLAPRVELVELRVNGRIRGVHVLTEQLDESTLRAQGCMPGDLYSGDAVALGAWSGIDNDLFQHAGLWEKAAANNHYEPTARAPLEALLAAVRAPASEARQARLRELLDIDAFAAFSALELLCATIHVDTEHNWRLYYDANRGRFVPVVWDLFGWDASNAPADGSLRCEVLSSPLHVVLHEDGGFLAARQRALASFLGGGGGAAFDAELAATITELTPAVERDPELTMQVRAFRPAQVVQAMHGLRARIAKLWSGLASEFLQPRGAIESWSTAEGVALQVSDRVPVVRVRLQLAQPLVPAAARVRWLQMGEVRQADVSAGMSVQGSAVTLDVALVARHVLQIDSMRTFEVCYNRAVVRPASYEIVLDGVAPSAIADVLCARGGAEGHLEPARAVPARPLLDVGRMWCAVVPQPRRDPVVWRGTVELSGVTFLDAPLLIEPGTVVRLSPEASVVARARVLARGTAAAPIRFEPSGDKPWGVFALQGRGADGSRLVHCELRDGSGYKTPLSEYSAMLSIHDVHDVGLEHCHLRDNRIVDDMLHAVYADLRVRECTFTSALSDAVDLDLSRGEFVRCVFRKSGNDGLDVMTSSAVVHECEFHGCGDKGMSVGEGSRLLAERARMLGCQFGTQVKDDSVAALIACEFVDNRCAIDAYAKNWRYGRGGRGFVYNSRMARNGKLATADKDSRILLRDCQVDGALAPDAGRVVLDGHAPDGPVRRDPAEQEALRGLATVGDR